MKITTAMIIDYLSNNGFITINRTHGNRAFTGLRLYYHGMTMRQDILYYCPDFHLELPEDLGDCCLVFPMSKDIAPIQRFYDWIACLCDKDRLFDLLQECFSIIGNWYAASLDAILSGGGLQQVIDLCGKVIRNPVIVDDPGFRALAFSKEMSRDLQDEESVFLVEHRHHSPQYIEAIASNPVFLRNLESRRGPFVHHYDFLPHPSIYCPIFAYERPVGFLTIVGHYSELTQGMVDLAGVLVNLLGDCLGTSGLASEQNSPQNHLLLEVLRGSQLDPVMINVALAKAGILPDKQYQIVLIAFVHGEDRIYMSKQQLIYLLGDVIIKCHFLEDGEAVAAMFDTQSNPAIELAAKLTALCFSRGLVAGLSLQFHGDAEIWRYYRQAKNALDWGDCLFPGDTRVFRYQECIAEDILADAYSSAERKALKHPALSQLEAHDNAKSTNYKETLKIFLNSGTDATMAVNTLHIHKNSLYYRLSRISELTGINLKDRAEVTHLCISFSIERVEQVLKERPGVI